MLQLRKYQADAIQKLRDGFTKTNRQMLYAPTGAGKTEIAIAIMAATAKKGKRVAMLMDRRILVAQTSTRLEKYKIEHGVLMAKHHKFDLDQPIQICSAQTIEKHEMPPIDLLVIDEAHCTRSAIKKYIDENPEVKVIGLSASPFTSGLKKIYGSVVSTISTSELVDLKMLSPLNVFIAKEIDMVGAEKVAGEWSQKDATERGIRITGDIVSEWVKKTHEIFGRPRKTIVFCAGVAHGEDLQRQFAEAGYNFISISYKDDEDFKSAAIDDFADPDGSVIGLIATDILTKGFDQADVMIGISARPYTKSFSSHVQQLGRVMRPHAEKSEAIWLDHSGNFLRFQKDWDLLYADGIDELSDSQEKAKSEPTLKEKEAAKCPKCGGLWGCSDVCQHCGQVRVRRNDVITLAGALEALKSGEKVEKYDFMAKARWYAELRGYASEKGYATGWAYHKYQEKFGAKPAENAATIAPGAEVKKWITSQNIRFAKRKGR